MGQPNQLDSLHLLAAPRAQKKEADFKELVLISDAFFPFADSIEAAHQYGIKYIVQSGGSIRDQEVIQKADECGMAMVFTSERHFRHEEFFMAMDYKSSGVDIDLADKFVERSLVSAASRPSTRWTRSASWPPPERRPGS